jgi:hypothetical protein
MSVCCVTNCKIFSLAINDNCCVLRDAACRITFSSGYFKGFYVLLTVHLDVILGNDQLDALFLNVFILCLYMLRAASAHHQEG